MNCKYIMLSERSNIVKTACSMIPFLSNFQKRQLSRNRKQGSGCLRLGWAPGLTALAVGGPFWGDGDVLGLHCGDGDITLYMDLMWMVPSRRVSFVVCELHLNRTAERKERRRAVPWGDFTFSNSQVGLLCKCVFKFWEFLGRREASETQMQRLHTLEKARTVNKPKDAQESKEQPICFPAAPDGPECGHLRGLGQVNPLTGTLATRPCSAGRGTHSVLTTQ